MLFKTHYTIHNLRVLLTGLKGNHRVQACLQRPLPRQASITRGHFFTNHRRSQRLVVELQLVVGNGEWKKVFWTDQGDVYNRIGVIGPATIEHKHN